MSNVTRILEAIDQGDPRASEELLPVVYDELRRLAAQRLSHEKPGQTLQATALVHEAYIRLVGTENQQWDSRGHFFAAAAEAMRRILVDSARRKRSDKRGRQQRRVELLEADLMMKSPQDDLLALDEALSKLAEVEPEMAELVELRYFAGLSVEQAARAAGISARTAKRHWAFARAWLLRELSDYDQ